VSPSIFDAYLLSYLEELKAGLDSLPPHALAGVLRLFEQARVEHRQIFIIGNGGSAATASHMACDLGKGTVDRDDPSFTRFRAISLSENNAVLTAIGNDLAFEDVFAEQLATLMNDGDVVVFISASGNSPNLLRAAKYARFRAGKLVGLLGFGGGALATLVDHALVVTTRNYGLSEDTHLVIQHVLTQFLRRLLAGPARRAVFLDRDGIINERPALHQYVTSWADFRWVDGIVPLLQELSALGYVLFVITNQQGIARGLLSETGVAAIHDEMTRLLEKTHGVRLARVLHCPHAADAGCLCRKPRPGLIYRALNESPFLIDVPQSILIGDTDSDVQAGAAAGIGTRILVSEDETAADGATHRVRTIAAAAALLAATEAERSSSHTTA
jgi:D-sedoheptulose 7-phosphate isomerase